MSEWGIENPEALQFDEGITLVAIELVGGNLHVTASAGPSSLVIREVRGPQLRVKLEEGRLEIWQRPPAFWGAGSALVSASVSLSVPLGCRTRIETVSASVVVEGLDAELSLRTVSGEATLESVRGPVTAATVSGAVASRGQTGKFRVETASGGVTLDAFGGRSARLQSVSGEVVADLKQAEPDSSIEIQTVSGAVFLRLPVSPSQKVRVDSISGRLTSAFPELRPENRPGSRSLRGSLGAAQGKVRISTISGAVSLLAGVPA
ncbi:MAG TPA: DUF4097 family beta strand repeat-containing protein [Candidatus Micrarchaeaceae archaeon]|nr:DUF4097 family beta strand repeat-containing protein [Candidatus Micrarchaeaceae archaeon]